MTRALITGIEGFTGQYLSAALHQAGYEIFGLARTSCADPNPNLEAIHVCDLTDLTGLTKVVDKVKPDVVVHLAAIAFVAHGDVEAIYKTNLLGSRNLLEALAVNRHPPSKVLLASSANIYGNSTEGELNESTPPLPANDYAVSKLAMEFMARLYYDRLPITVVRPFNYTGVGQSGNFLLPKIVNHVRNRVPVIELGNLNVARDFSDVRAIVGYYKRLLECPHAAGEVFNVCSGRAYTLQEVLEMVRGISNHDFEVRVNPAFVRENEVKRLLGNKNKLLSVVGEIADIPLQETLSWMLEASA